MDATVIDRLAQAEVLVVGDVLVDRFVEGHVSRVSPEAPVPVLKYGAERSLLGGAGNVAANLLAFGASVTLAGVCGADAAADELAALCGGFDRLATRLIRDKERPTTVKSRFLSGWHQLLRVDSEAAAPVSDAVARDLYAAAGEALERARVLVLSDYAKGVLTAETIARLIADARAAGAAIIVDPKKRKAEFFAGASVITPNVEEMFVFTGIRADSDEAATAACARVLERVPLDAVLLTRGEAGMTLARRDATPLHFHAETHRVFDVTGAGDTVVATLAAALAVEVPLADAVRLANVAAGIAVTKPGTATVARQELRGAFGDGAARGVADQVDAAATVAGWKAQGLKVGFTNGCFDLLHRGHLHSLEQAARRADRLVVGLNSDASTRRLKGVGRPVQDEATRAAVLAALRCVDLVVIFAEDTPEALIRTLSPEVLFKGADYRGKEVAGAAFVEGKGGHVEFLPLLDGHSTTGTVARLRADETG